MYYVRWNYTDEIIVEGPKSLASQYKNYSDAELYAIGWIKLIPFDYNAFGFNPQIHHEIDSFYDLDDSGAIPVVRKNVILDFRSLEDVQTFLVSESMRVRDYHLGQGFIYGNVLFDGNEEARLNWSATVTGTLATAFLQGLEHTNLAQDPTPHEWTAADNSTVYFQSLELIHCGLMFMQWASACYTFCRMIKNNILSQPDSESAWNYWNSLSDTDWPDRNLGVSPMTFAHMQTPPPN